MFWEKNKNPSVKFFTLPVVPIVTILQPVEQTATESVEPTKVKRAEKTAAKNALFKS